MLFLSWLRQRMGAETRSGRNRRHRPRPRLRPWIEFLEDRCLPSALTVRNTNDSGAGSLRADIAAAHSGDTIKFDPGLAGQTIALTSGELTISKSLDIEGLGEIGRASCRERV